jgi:nucleoside-diphosphate-sugar epimerase
MNQRVIVTGGTGLLGSYILRWLIRRGYTHVTGTYQNDNPSIPHDLKDNVSWSRLRLPDMQDAYDIIAHHDWVIHSAGLVSYHKEDKYRLLDINQTGTEHIVNASLAHNISHLLYVGSIGALGKETSPATLNESHGWLQNEFSTAYGLSKYLGESEVWRGAAEGLNVSVVLPSVILGTGDWQRSSLQIVDRIVHYPAWYPSGQTGYVDVRDVASFIGLLLERNMTGERWILNGGNLSYQEVYKQIGDHLSLRKNFRESPRWMARLMLLISNLKAGKLSVPDIINQAYGKFSYDASKSIGVEGFRYRPLEDTFREVTGAYLQGGGKVLEF